MANLSQKMQLAKSMFGKETETAAKRVYGTATSDSSGGMVDVQIGGGDSISLPTVGRVETGDDVLVLVQDGIPSVIGSKGSGDAIPRNFVQSTTPTGALIIGDTWTDTDDGSLYTWDGSNWVQTGGGSPVAVQVTVSASAVDYQANTATLGAVLRVDGVVTAPDSYQWQKNAVDMVGETSSSLNVTDLNAVYTCIVEKSDIPTQSGSYDFQAIKAAASGASDYLFSVGGNVLFAQDGDDYGMVATNTGTEIVPLTWSGGVPTLGSPVGYLGQTVTLIDNLYLYKLMLDSTGLSLLDNYDAVITQIDTYGISTKGAKVKGFPVLTTNMTKVYASSNVSMPYSSAGTFSPVSLGGATEEYNGGISGVTSYVSSGGPSGKGYIKVTQEGWYRLSAGARVSGSGNFTGKICLGIYNSSNVLQTRACQLCDYIQVSPYFFNAAGDLRYLNANDRIVFEAVSLSNNSNILASASEKYTFFAVEFMGKPTT